VGPIRSGLAVGEPLDPLDRSVRAIDVEHEARGVRPVADDPQPAPQQQERVVGCADPDQLAWT
jgi:hypothetical protein